VPENSIDSGSIKNSHCLMHAAELEVSEY